MEFTCQNIKGRLLSLLPLALFIPLINLLLQNILELKKMESAIVTIVILYLILCCVCKINGKIFEKKGILELTDSKTMIRQGNHVFEIVNDDILQLRAERIGVFGQKVAVFRIKYKIQEGTKLYSIYSEDLGLRRVEESSVWPVYAKLKKDIFGK